MVKKVIINLDLSKASGPDCIPVVVLKNCELDLCYILTELFNKFLKESCFPDCREVSSVVLVFKNVGKVLQVKTTTLLVFFLWFVKSLKNFRLTADLLTFVSGRITRAFNRSAATRAVALDISKVFAGFGMLVFFINLCLMEFQARHLALFLLFSVIDNFKWFWMESLHKNTQLMLRFVKAPFLVLHVSYYTLMTFLKCYL